MPRMDADELVEFTKLIQSNNAILNCTVGEAQAVAKFSELCGFGHAQVLAATDVGPVPYYSLVELEEFGVDMTKRLNFVLLFPQGGPPRNASALARMVGRPGESNSGIGGFCRVYAELTGDSELKNIGGFLLDKMQAPLEKHILELYGQSKGK